MASFVTSRTDTASQGSTTVISGIVLIIPISSKGIWVPPFNAAVIPGSEPTTFTFCFAYAQDIKIWSHARRAAKGPNVWVNGMNPLEERPAATPTIFASCTPQSKVLSGNAARNGFVPAAFIKSASSTTTLLSCSAMEIRVSQNSFLSSFFPIGCSFATFTFMVCLLLFPDLLRLLVQLSQSLFYHAAVHRHIV